MAGVGGGRSRARVLRRPPPRRDSAQAGDPPTRNAAGPAPSPRGARAWEGQEGPREKPGARPPAGLPLRPQGRIPPPPTPRPGGPPGPNVPRPRHAGPGPQLSARGRRRSGAPRPPPAPPPRAPTFSGRRPGPGALGSGLLLRGSCSVSPVGWRGLPGLGRGGRRRLLLLGGGRRRLGGPAPPPGRKRPPRHRLLGAADPLLRPPPPRSPSGNAFLPGRVSRAGGEEVAAEAEEEAGRPRPGQRSGAGAGPRGESWRAGRGLGQAFAVPQFPFLPRERWGERRCSAGPRRAVISSHERRLGGP